jgi:hypothetical protein
LPEKRRQKPADSAANSQDRGAKAMSRYVNAFELLAEVKIHCPHCDKKNPLPFLQITLNDKGEHDICCQFCRGVLKSAGTVKGQKADKITHMLRKEFFSLLHEARMTTEFWQKVKQDGQGEKILA